MQIRDNTNSRRTTSTTYVRALRSNEKNASGACTRYNNAGVHNNIFKIVNSTCVRTKRRRGPVVYRTLDLNTPFVRNSDSRILHIFEISRVYAIQNSVRTLYKVPRVKGKTGNPRVLHDDR